MFRGGFVVGLFGLGVLLLSSHAPTQAQGKKTDRAKQIQQLKKTIAEKDQRIVNLQNQIQKLKADLAQAKKKNPGAAKLQKDLDKANDSIAEKDKLIASLRDKSPKGAADLTRQLNAATKKIRELAAVKNAPFVHAKILKLKTSDDALVKQLHAEADRTLAKIDGVRGVWIGKPAENATPELAQKGFHLGIVVLLDDADALQKFLDDPLHKQFTDQLADKWERPTVYDIQRDDEPKKAEPKKKAAKKKKAD